MDKFLESREQGTGNREQGIEKQEAGNNEELLAES
jgi:hypothetical protein